ncbi:MAG: phytoene desaturase family protein [Acidimicrobiales bacterium]
MRVVVVGAGLGGLAAACHLGGAGHEVVVLERSARPGGRAGLLEDAGYRLDTGPSVLTMSGILAETFAAAGASMDAYLDLVRVDPAYRACFASGDDPFGGGVIRVRHGREAMCEEIRSTCGEAEAAAFSGFADWLGKLYRCEMPYFIARNYDSPLDLARPSALRPLLALARMGGLRRLSAVVDERFADPRLRKLFSFQAMYAGLAPTQALALYAVITYMDTIEGVWFPIGGMHAVARGLAAAAANAGVELRYDTSVTRILRSGRPAGPGPIRGAGAGPVCGVRLADGERIAADAVVANPDLPAVYRELLGGLPAPRVARGGRYSPSCVVWVAGVAAGGRGAGVGTELAHHNLHFSKSWEAAFGELLDEGRRMTDPSILVSVPSVSDPGLAPPGGRALFALEPVPNLDGRVDWASERGVARAALAERVERLGYLGGGKVEVSAFADPLDWRDAGMERGTPFALAHRFFQSGPFRPDNVDARVPGLVLVGSGTRPGVGIPMVLISGRLAAERVDQLARRRPARRARR